MTRPKFQRQIRLKRWAIQLLEMPWTLQTTRRQRTPMNLRPRLHLRRNRLRLNQLMQMIQTRRKDRILQNQ